MEQCFLVMTRDPPERFWRKLVEKLIEMIPFNLPDLSETSRPPQNEESQQLEAKS